MRATLSALSTLSASLGQLVRRRDAARGEVEQGLQADEGAVTAEYAVVIMGAVAFAGVLVAIMRSGEVRAFLLNLIEQALSSAG